MRYQVIQLENGKYGVKDTERFPTIQSSSGPKHYDWVISFDMTLKRATEWASELNHCSGGSMLTEYYSRKD